MRCSTREPRFLHPSFMTSTPLAQRPRSLIFDPQHLSPIVEASSAPKTLFEGGSSRRRALSTKNPKTGYPTLVVVSSDSEGELVPPNRMPLLRRSSRKDSRVETVRFTAENKSIKTSLRKRPSNFLDEFATEPKKGGGRISRVEAILDEIVKETLQKSNADSPSNNKLKSDESVDAMIDQVMKNKDIEVKYSQASQRKPPTKRQSKVKKSVSSLVEEKENLVRKIVNGSQEVEILRVNVKTKNPKSNEGRSHDPHDGLNNSKKRKTISPDSGVATEFRVPEIYKLSEIEWKQTKNHIGVFISKIFTSMHTTISYIKIEAKCVLKKTPSKDQVFIICEGIGEVTIFDSKMKIVVGDAIRVHSGHEFEFFNRGLRKPLILSYTDR